ncbi:sulfatase-like hydrolase/transferase [Dactylosporangium maewongense]|uniref:sulfatase-like hydrolase/transferase n=1 Tax=Dactylosporangium maewongense TaxID=634393 RepID=UPI003CD0A4EB
MDDARTGQTFAMPKALAWLRDHGREYPNAMVSTPSCCPSRATILSGRYAHNHGVTQQGASAGSTATGRCSTSCTPPDTARPRSASSSTPGTSRDGRRTSTTGH